MRKKRGRTMHQHICTECLNQFLSRDANARTCGMFCAIESALKKQKLKAKASQGAA